MDINNVRIFLNPRAAESTLKATATMVVNNELLLQSIRVVGDEQKESGEESPLRVTYPVQRLSNGNLRHCMYLSNAEVREKYDRAILDAYNSVKNGDGESNTVVLSDSQERVPYEITRASIFPSAASDSYRAKVGIELDGELWLRGMFLVVRDDGGLFLRMPRRQIEGDRRWMDYFHPVDQEARSRLTNAVMPYYVEMAGQYAERRTL